MAIVLPLWMADWQPPFSHSTYGPFSKPFELFGFTASAWLLILAYYRIKGKRTPSEFLAAILPVLLGFYFLTLLPELSNLKSWDYACYETAAKAISRGFSPYESCYLYPPLLAQVMSLGHRGIQEVRQVLGWAGLVSAWDGLYYFFQTGQFFALMLLYFLTEKYARQNRLDRLGSGLLVTALLVFNNALFRTLRHNQVNILIVDLTMIGLVYLISRPWISGLALGLAAHLKLFSLLMLIPLGLARRWKVMAWAGIGIVLPAILAFSTDWLGFFSTWEKALMFDALLRNNSLLAVAANSLRILHIYSPNLARSIYLVLAAAGVTCCVVRYYQREKSAWTAQAKLSAHLVDALALALWVSPITWEHHFLLAVPLIIWAAGNLPGAADLLQGKNLNPDGAWLLASAGLMIVMPTFDLFLFSYHQLAGLLIWTWLTRPARIAPGRLPETA